MQRLGVGLAAAWLALAVTACGGGGSAGPVTTVLATVPTATGLTEASATSAITSAGLTLGTVTQQSSTTVAAGSVISQSPAAGTSVTSGSVVNLVVSSGPPQVLIPNVVGVSQASATIAITAVGLTVGTVTQQSSTSVASGNVISQSPAAGGTAASGSAVNLVVSSGPPPVNVPSVVGLTQAAATTAITSAGLAVGTLAQASSGTVPVGSVISQNPTAGTSVSAGTAVNLVVSATVTYAVSVTVSGLISGASVTVLDNGADSLTFQSNSTQQFAIQLANNATYAVTVSSQPNLEFCTVTGGSGPVTGPVAVSISCSLAPPSTSYPAFVAPYPLILSGQTPANVIPNPRIIPVFFSNTPDQSATLAYLQALVVSAEWSALAEYGVGAANVGAPVDLTSAAPATTTTAGINSYVAANAASWGSLDGSEIFILYYPPATTITDDVSSYHSWAKAGTGQQVPFAVIPNYSLAGHGYVQYHELAEASTNPTLGGGYFVPSHDATTWSFNETELADMCGQFSQFLDPALSQLMLGIWSDAAVKNGQAPCTTAGSVGLGPAVGAYPVLPDTYLTSAAPGYTNASVGIAPGASVTIPINIFSYGPVTAPIALTVTQLNTNSAKTNALTFSLDQTSGLNGSVAHLTITAPTTPLASTTNYAWFLVAASLPAANNNSPQSVFPGLVTNPGASCSSQSTGSSGSGESVLYGFTGGADGALPYDSLVQGSDGNFYGTTAGNFIGGPAFGSNKYGTVFKITPGGALTTLHSFAGTDGATPFAGLAQGSDGSFYGTTYYGGGSNDGTVFKITPSGTLTTLYSFIGTDGFYPNAGLVLGSDGNFYGTTAQGVGNAYGTVFKITSSGTLTTLHNFTHTDGSLPFAGLVQGSDGNLYGSTSQGGGSNDGTVFKMTPSGSLTTLYSFSGTDGSDPSAALVQGSDGNFYGTTYLGGANSLGTVFTITPGGTLTTLYSFSGTDGSNPHGALVEGSDGNFYGTTYVGGANGFGTVFKITPGGTLTTLHSFSYADGAYIYGGLVQGADGSLYGTSYAGGGCDPGTVFKISAGL